MNLDLVMLRCRLWVCLLALSLKAASYRQAAKSLPTVSDVGVEVRGELIFELLDERGAETTCLSSRAVRRISCKSTRVKVKFAMGLFYCAVLYCFNGKFWKIWENLEIFRRDFWISWNTNFQVVTLENIFPLFCLQRHERNFNSRVLCKKFSELVKWRRKTFFLGAYYVHNCWHVCLKSF